MAGLSRRFVVILLGAMATLRLVAARSILLMCCVGMIFGLEVLGLVRATFAIFSHGFSQVESRTAGRLMDEASLAIIL
jgi:hypothetical protein